jgi:hypothetical protein
MFRPARARAQGFRRLTAALLPALVLPLLTAPGAAAEFSFLRAATDQLAVPGFEAGTAVTPENDLFTGYTEIAVRVGASQRKFLYRNRDWQDGYLPVLRSTVVDGQTLYVMETFAEVLGGDGTPGSGQAVNFFRVTAQNVGTKSARARVWVSARNNNGYLRKRGNRLIRKYRFGRPMTPTRSGLYSQPGEAFNPNSVWAYGDNTLTRDGKLILSFDPAPAGVVRTLKLRPTAGTVTPRTMIGRTLYSIRLKPGERRSYEFRMPVVPVALTDPATVQMVAQARFDDHKARSIALWRQRLAPATVISVPERKVTDAYWANLIAMLQPRYRTADGYWVQPVNKTRYHAFWLRDGAFISEALDMLGFHQVADENLRFFPTWQREDGLFISRPEEYDGFGEALWAFAEHVRRTGDLDFAKAMMPYVQKAMAWFQGQHTADPLGLMPAVGTPLDNELIPGHLAGDNFWAYAGILGAVDLAKRLGDESVANDFFTQFNAFKDSLNAALQTATIRAGGRIPPALDHDGGQEWGNLWAVYPLGVLPASDPKVTATIDHKRSLFREGIATYGDGKLLHDYLGFRVFETELLRGAQGNVVRGLYDELAHTTATHAGFETGLAVHGDRIVDDSTTPHGWFSAEYVSLLRNMLLRESSTGLVLMSAVSPAWLRPGRTISVRKGSTTLGNVEFTLDSKDGGATLTWNTAVPADKPIVWPVPYGVTKVTAPGLDPTKRFITLPGPSGKIEVKWTLTRTIPTYESAVARLLKEYRSAKPAARVATLAPSDTGAPRRGPGGE